MPKLLTQGVSLEPKNGRQLIGIVAGFSSESAGIGRYLTFYNARRPHSSLDRKTPDQAYFNALAPMMVAA